MIDTKNLNDRISDTRTLILWRIQQLSKLAQALDGIEYEIALERGDEYLKEYIRAKSEYCLMLTTYDEMDNEKLAGIFKELMDIDG